MHRLEVQGRKLTRSDSVSTGSVSTRSSVSALMVQSETGADEEDAVTHSFTEWNKMDPEVSMSLKPLNCLFR